uniref:Uncharacterized protein n=1 Tax=Aegilops tauschii subsp. strangulata TaxID=200361 RepID=A0A453DN65_AEGTS
LPFVAPSPDQLQSFSPAPSPTPRPLHPSSQPAGDLAVGAKLPSEALRLLIRRRTAHRRGEIKNPPRLLS